MKHLLNLVLLFISCNSFAQEIKLWKHKGQIVSITDSVSNYKIVVDSSHLYVSVYDKRGVLIWKNHTTICNYWKDWKDHVEITTIELKPINKIIGGNNANMGVLVTHCICWGYFELKTGKYVYLGCD